MCFRGEVTSCIVPCFALPVNHKFCAPAGNTARNHEAPGAENFLRRNNSLLREASLRVVAFVETGNFRDFSDGIVKELSVYIMLVPETLYKELSTFSTGFSTKAKTGTAQSFSTILPVIYQTAKQGSAQGEIRQISLHNHIISGFGSKAVLLADMTEVDAGPQPKYLSRKGTWSTWKLRPRRYSSRPASVGKSKVRR